MSVEKAVATVGLVTLVIGGMLCAAEPAAEPAIDEASGLKMAPGWELVRNNCISCHSAKQFLQQRGTRETWRSVILWMQGRAGLWPLDAATESTILDYLETHHGPGESFRRPPIPAYLMPVNPYASEARKAFEEKVKAEPK
jgi:hypothetical protein